MNSPLNIVYIFTGLLALSACTSVSEINQLWGGDNDLIRKTNCQKELPLNKEEAISAILVAYNQLGIIVQNADYKTGLVIGVGKAPKPLSYAEFEHMKAVEGSRIHNPLFSWNTDFNIVMNALVNERSSTKTVMVNINGRMDFEGSRQTFNPVSELPPEGLRIACNKIWEEVRRTAFLQNKTLK